MTVAYWDRGSQDGLADSHDEDGGEQRCNNSCHAQTLRILGLIPIFYIFRALYSALLLLLDVRGRRF